METQKKILFSLSQEELFVTLTYLRTETLIGLNGALLEDLSEAEIRLILGVAERALIAREFLVPAPETTHFQLAPLLLSVIGVCAKPDKSLIVNFDRPERPVETFFFHTAGKLRVGHTIPLSAIHQFAVVESKKMIFAAVKVLLPLEDQEAPTHAQEFASLPQTLLTQAREAVTGAGKPQAAAAVLAETEWAPDLVEALAISLSQPLANITLIYFDHASPDTAATDGFTLLAARNGVWILKPGEAENSVMIKAVATSEASAWIQELTNRL